MAAVLLIDDVPVVRTALCKFITRAGHAVTECGGGEEAWSKMTQERFDLVVTDLWMKAGSGMEFIQRARAGGLDTPIIAITSGDPNSPATSAGSGALRAGANRVLIKPVTRTALLDAITQLLGVAAQ